MVAHTQSIHILDSCPEESPEVRGTSAALAGIAGKVIGLLENRKYQADAFLRAAQSPRTGARGQAGGLRHQV